MSHVHERKKTFGTFPMRQARKMKNGSRATLPPPRPLFFFFFFFFTHVHLVFNVFLTNLSF